MRYRRLRKTDAPRRSHRRSVTFDALGVYANTGGGAGLDVHAREFLRALKRIGVPAAHAGTCSCQSSSSRRYSHGLVMGLPVFWQPGLMRAHVRMGYLVHEADRLPGPYRAKLRALDRVWTASRFGRDIIRAAVPGRPVDVVPGGVDVDVFHPRRPLAAGRPWTFAAIGKPEGRKNYEALIPAYRNAFRGRDDVILKILATGHEPGRPALRRLLAESDGPDTAPIELLAPLQTTDDIADLLRAADVFVLPTHGEGWGLPILEAMACGCCVITTGWSAPVDYVTDETGLLLDYRLVPARCPHFGNLFRGARWAEPHADQLVEQMRWTYANRDAAAAMGERAAEHVRARWTWDDAARRAGALLGLQVAPAENV